MTEPNYLLLQNGSEVLLEDGTTLLLEEGAEGIFRSSISDIVAKLVAIGKVPIIDPRNARPGTVFVELPTFDVFTNHIADTTITIRVLAPPPGNLDAMNWVLDQADEIMVNSGLGIISGRPTTAIIGTQELPAYDLVCRLASRRF